MAASITISGLTLAADGKTLTGTIAGGTAPYSPASGVTGISVRQSSDFFGLRWPGVATISGSTLTVILASPISAGSAVGVVVSSSGNITDGAGNTLTGQAYQGLTNNSAVAGTSFSAGTNAAKLVVLGPVAIANGSLQLSTNGVTMDATVALPDYQVEFECNCTDIDIVTQGGQTARFTIDSGAEQTLSVNSPNDRLVVRNLSTGLAAGSHLVRFTGGMTFNSIILRGGARTITSVAKAQYQVTNWTDANTTIPASSTLVNLAGGYASSVQGGVAGKGGFTQEFRFTGTAVEQLGVPNANCYCDIQTDGVSWFGSVSTAAQSGKFAQIHLSRLGVLPGTHTMRVVSAEGAGFGALRIQNGTRINNGGGVAAGATTITVASAANLVVGEWIQIDIVANKEVRRIEGIAGNVLTLNEATSFSHPDMAVVNGYRDPAGSISAWNPVDRSAGKAWIIGDSITRGQVATRFNGIYTDDARNGILYRAAQTLNLDHNILGTGGVGAQILAGQTGQITQYKGTPAPYTHGIIASGTNDVNGNATYSQIQSHIQSIIDAGKTAMGTGKPILILETISPTFKVAELVAWNNSAAALAASNNTGGYIVRYVKISNGVNPTTYNATTNPGGDMADTLHPDVTGFEKFANNTIPALAATGFSLTPAASSGAVGAPVTLSLTRALGTKWMQGDTVTLTDGGAGGTFGALSFTSGVSNVATVTYTPTSAGAKSIAATNAQGWENPAAATYTAIVSDTLDPTLPTRTLGTDGLTLGLTFSESVAGNSGLTVKVAGVSRTFSIAGTGATRTLTLSSPAYQGQAVLLSYAPGNIADTAGNALVAFADAVVTNTSTVPVPDTAPPTLTGASGNVAGDVLALTFSEPVTGVSAAQFAIPGHALSNVAGSGASRTLSILPPLFGGETAVLNYSGSGTIDGAGNPLATFSGVSITNGSLMPAPFSAADRAMVVALAASNARIEAALAVITPQIRALAFDSGAAVVSPTGATYKNDAGETIATRTKTVAGDVVTLGKVVISP